MNDTEEYIGGPYYAHPEKKTILDYDNSED